MKRFYNNLFKAILTINVMVWVFLFLCFNYQILSYLRKRNYQTSSRVVYEWSPNMAPDSSLEIILRHYPLLYKYLKVAPEPNSTQPVPKWRRIGEKTAPTKPNRSADLTRDHYVRLMDEALRPKARHSRLDASRKYLVFDSYLTIPHLPENSERKLEDKETAVVTLCTQVSASGLSHLPVFSRSWAGPISLSLLVQSGREASAAAMFFRRLSACVDRRNQLITVSIVVPWNRTFEVDVTAGGEPIDGVRDCDDVALAAYYGWLLTADRSVPESTSTEYPFPNTTPQFAGVVGRLDRIQPFRYPQNLMRNVALLGARTPFVFGVDGDLHLPPGLYRNVSAYLSDIISGHDDMLQRGIDTGDYRKRVLVVPAFELSDIIGQFTPRDKSELLTLVAQGLAREYHKATFPAAQRATNYPTWKNLNTTEPFGVGYPILYKTFYEPFHIVHISAPLYEEKFVGYGLTRNTQALELFMAGYKFFALNHAFCLHKKFDTKSARPKWRQTQTYRNLLKFPVFRQILTARYGKTVSLGRGYESLFQKHNRSLRKIWSE